MAHTWDPQTFQAGARQAGRSESTIQASLAAARAIKSVHPDLPVVLTLNHLAHLADVNADFLQEVAHRRVDAYRVFRVKKRGVPNSVPAPPRRYRTICVPEPNLMQVQRWIAQNILQVTPLHPASYAFANKRDLVGAAHQHLGAKWIVKMDVRHFFESISEKAVYRVFRSFGYGALLSFQMARICTRLARHRGDSSLPSKGRGGSRPYRLHRMGHLPQGAPSSPMLANRAVENLDKNLTILAGSTDWRYTRYADDLAFSRLDGTTRKEVLNLVRKAENFLRLAGLKAHRQKTSIISPGGRKLILGVLVDTGKPRLTKAFRNNIETHLYALAHDKVGPAKHQEKRGFASKIGMRRHIMGLIAFAHQVDEDYAAELYSRVNGIDWDRV
jgi:RNA-directed DNA polymerase